MVAPVVAVGVGVNPPALVPVAVGVGVKPPAMVGAEEEEGTATVGEGTPG